MIFQKTIKILNFYCLVFSMSGNSKLLTPYNKQNTEKNLTIVKIVRLKLLLLTFIDPYPYLTIEALEVRNG